MLLMLGDFGEARHLTLQPNFARRIQHSGQVGDLGDLCLLSQANLFGFIEVSVH